MELKKSKQVNVETKRGIFFLIGLASALLFVFGLYMYRTEVDEVPFVEQEAIVMEPDVVYIPAPAKFIPPTQVIDAPPPPPPPDIPQDIIEVDNTKEVKKIKAVDDEVKILVKTSTQVTIPSEPVAIAVSTYDENSIAVFPIYPGCARESAKGRAQARACMLNKLHTEVTNGIDQDEVEGGGLVLYSFIIGKNGRIESIVVKSRNKALAKEIKMAIMRINRKLKRTPIVPGEDANGQPARLQLSISKVKLNREE